MKDNNSRSSNSSAANVGFEAKLWQAADALRNNMDAAEYANDTFGRVDEYFLKQLAICQCKVLN